jgi:glycosyltransferase involved in cell wall biosynthesis
MLIDSSTQHTDGISVAVVIPCYRCSSTINRAIESVLNQTLVPTEIILVDDASGDETLESLMCIRDVYSDLIKVVPLNNNIGASGARNAGWAVATQQYIAFLDSDDAWHPQKLEIQYAFMMNHPEVMLCGHTHRELVQSDVLPDWNIGTWHYTPVTKWSLLLSNRFITPSVMLRRNIYQRFTSGQRHMEDHMLWMEMVCGGIKAVKLSAELAATYKSAFGEGGLSAQMWLMEKGDLANYKKLYQSGHVNLFQLVIFSFYSLIKYMRRLVVFYGKALWRNYRLG